MSSNFRRSLRCTRTNRRIANLSPRLHQQRSVEDVISIFHDIISIFDDVTSIVSSFYTILQFSWKKDFSSSFYNLKKLERFKGNQKKITRYRIKLLLATMAKNKLFRKKDNEKNLITFEVDEIFFQLN